MEKVKKDSGGPSQASANVTPKTQDATAEYSERNERLRFLESQQERNQAILKRLNKSTLLDFCEENSVDKFHLNEECEEEHCLIGKEVFCLMSDLVQKCSEMDPRFKSKLLWTGSSAEGTKMWLPDEFDFLMDLLQLKGKCECNNLSAFFTEIILKKKFQELWSDLCYKKDSSVLSPIKLKNHFTDLVQKAASLLDRNKYKNIRFDDKPHMKDGIKVTKVGITLSIYWCGDQYKNMQVKIDLTLGVPFLLTEVQLSGAAYIRKRIVKRLVDHGCIHIIPHTRRMGMWRPSFSTLEFEMVKNLTKKQEALYKCLKLCRDIHTGFTYYGDTLPSYYLKTFLFNYFCEDSDGSEAIETDDFHSSFRNILHRFIQVSSSSVERKIIPHFFLIINFVLGRYDMRWCKSTFSLLEK